MSTTSIAAVPENVNIPSFTVLSGLLSEMGREARERPKELRAELEESFQKQQAKIRRNLEGLPPDGLQKMREEIRAACQANVPRLVLQTLSEVKEKRIEWLWADRIPKGKLTIFSGNPDCGKTTVACDLIARFTTGREFPDGAAAVPARDVLLLSAEDDAADTLKPRLVAAGAEASRVHIAKAVSVPSGASREVREFALDTDLHILAEALAENSTIGLVVIDPLSSYLGSRDMNKEQEVRRVLVPLRDLAESTGVTVIGIGHFSKRSDVSALHRVGGAVALTGVARAVWLFTKSPDVDGEFQMLLGKGNLTKKRTGLRYTFGEKAVSAKITAPVILWGEETTGDADSVLSMDGEEKQSAKAERFVAEALEDGMPHPSEPIISEGKDKGISKMTLFRARKDLGVRTQRVKSEWVWQLEKASNDPF